MKISQGTGYGYSPGVDIDLTCIEVYHAISAWLVAHGVYIDGSRTLTINGEPCKAGRVYVDPGGFVITPGGRKISGTRGRRK